MSKLRSTIYSLDKELKSIESQMKNVIKEHQTILLKMKTEPNNQSLKLALNEAQNKLILLSLQQKQIIQKLRKPNNLTSTTTTTTTTSSPAATTKLAFNNNNNSNNNNNNNKLLIPVSAATATGKTKKQQIVVVPTPGGGHRLATQASKPSPSIQPPIKPPIPAPNIKSSTSNHIIKPSTRKSQVIAPYRVETRIQRRISQEEQLLKPVIKILDFENKEHFMAALGLVTKAALDEIQNKKCERKRRTTANPQFSNAAIEAKRITALEVAEKRAKRKLMLAAAAAAASNKNNQPKQSLTASNPPVTVGQRISSSLKQIKQESSSDLDKQIPQNCFVCNEICNSDLDAIISCKGCKCIFHATCSSTIDDITKSMVVPCPKCDEKRPLTEELGSNKSDNSSTSQKPKQNGYLRADANICRKRRSEKERLVKVRDELDTKTKTTKRKIDDLKKVLEIQKTEKENLLDKQKKIADKLHKFVNIVNFFKQELKSDVHVNKPEEKGKNDDEISVAVASIQGFAEDEEMEANIV